MSCPYCGSDYITTEIINPFSSTPEHRAICKNCCARGRIFDNQQKAIDDFEKPEYLTKKHKEEIEESIDDAISRIDYIS